MRFIHSFSPMEEVVLLTQDDIPYGFWVQRAQDVVQGAIYVARAVKKIKGAWFVDIGEKGTAFLPDPDFYYTPEGVRTTSPLGEGDVLLVQVQRSSFEEKNPKVSSHISLPSDLSIYMPGQSGLSVSRQLNEEKASELKNVLFAHIDTENEAVMVRTAAAEVAAAEIIQSIEEQRVLWKKILKAACYLREKKQYGSVFEPPSLACQVAKTYQQEILEAVCDDREVYDNLKDILPFISFSSKSVWVTEGVGEALEEVLSRNAVLPSGGSLVVEPTSACVCFDVNAGAGSWGQANSEACTEIIRQIRLKGLGGQMIVDFAGKKEKGELRRLSDRLKVCDLPLRIWGVSNIGFVEFSMERSRKPVALYYADQVDMTASDLMRKLWFAEATADVVLYAPFAVCEKVRPFLSVLEEKLRNHVAVKQGESIKIEGIKE